MSTLRLTGYMGMRSSTKLPHLPNSLIRGNRERDVVNCPAKGKVALRCCFASLSWQDSESEKLFLLKMFERHFITLLC